MTHFSAVLEMIKDLQLSMLNIPIGISKQKNITLSLDNLINFSLRIIESFRLEIFSMNLQLVILPFKKQRLFIFSKTILPL